MINSSDNNKKTISSDLTFFYKFIFTIAWIGGFGYGTFGSLLSQHDDSILVVWLLGSLFLYWGCARLKYIAIDKNNIYISNFIRTIKVPLHEIDKISENAFINIHPVWISFKTTTRFGRKIMFMPKFIFRVLPFCSHPVVKELCELAKDADNRVNMANEDSK